MADIEWLEKRVRDIRASLRDAEAELQKAKLDACPVKIGDIVVATRNGKRHRIIDVDVRWNKPWVTANPMKADGTFGTARRQLFDHYTIESE